MKIAEGVGAAEQPDPGGHADHRPGRADQEEQDHRPSRVQHGTQPDAEQQPEDGELADGAEQEIVDGDVLRVRRDEAEIRDRSDEHD